jgi:hypothetical protein
MEYNFVVTIAHPCSSLSYEPQNDISQGCLHIIFEI